MVVHLYEAGVEVDLRGRLLRIALDHVSDPGVTGRRGGDTGKKQHFALAERMRRGEASHDVRRGNHYRCASVALKHGRSVGSVVVRLPVAI